MNPYPSPSNTFSTLPLVVYDEIFSHVSDQVKKDCDGIHYFTNREYSRRGAEETVWKKRRYWSMIKPYAEINHTWRMLVQRVLFRELVIAPFEIPIFRQMISLNPDLAIYVTSLTILSRKRKQGDPPRHSSLDEYVSHLPLSISSETPDTLEGGKIYTIWLDILRLTDEISLYRGANLKTLNFHVTLGKGSHYRFVDLPKDLPILGGGQTNLKKLQIEIPRGKRGDELSINSVRELIGSVGQTVEELHLIATDLEEPRWFRRELYVNIYQTIPKLLTANLTPLLQHFTLTYPSFTPVWVREERIYPLTLLDDGLDLLSPALRILSKQLVSFRYYGGRISTSLFRLDEDEPLQGRETEPLTWPNLKIYIVHFAPITPSGIWLLDLPPPESGDEYEVNLDLSTEKNMSATDHDWIDPTFKQGYHFKTYHMECSQRSSFRGEEAGHFATSERFRPKKVLLDPLFRAASLEMVGKMPKIRFWELKMHHRRDIILKFCYEGKLARFPWKVGRHKRSYNDDLDFLIKQGRGGVGRPQLFYRSNTYEPPKAALNVWKQAHEDWKGKTMLPDTNRREQMPFLDLGFTRSHFTWPPFLVPGTEFGPRDVTGLAIFTNLPTKFESLGQWWAEESDVYTDSHISSGED